MAVAEAVGLTPRGWVFPSYITEPEPLSWFDADRLLHRGQDLLAAAAGSGLRMLVPGDTGWPAGTAADELPCLWVAGNVDLGQLLRASVTVTGSRDCSVYGAGATKQLAAGLAQVGYTVVALASSGVDDLAVRAAVEHGGPVVVVGAGEPLVSVSGRLREERADAGGFGVVSPFPPGIPPSQPRRAIAQRLLASLSPVTVIPEASADSGAMQVAAFAAELGRTVCAVAGRFGWDHSDGGDRLLSTGGARLVRDVDDIAAAHGASGPPVAPGGPVLFEVTGLASWDDGRWRSRKVPTVHVLADNAERAADVVFDLLFGGRREPAVLDAAVRSPDGSYRPIQISIG